MYYKMLWCAFFIVYISVQRKETGGIRVYFYSIRGKMRLKSAGIYYIIRIDSGEKWGKVPFCEK